MKKAKVLIFNGSPRQNGYTAKLLKEVALGAQNAGAEIKEYNLCHAEISGCQSCFYCRHNEGCSVNDYLRPMYEDIKSATGIAFGSPIYFYQITGQAKQWLDRMFPMIDMKGSTPVPRYPGKKTVTVFAQGNADKEAFSASIQSFNNFFTAFGWTVLGSLTCAGTSQNIPDLQDLLAQAYTLGFSLGELS